MGLIQDEYNLSKSKGFKTVRFNKKDIVIISRENVAIAEAMIRNDSDYIKMDDKQAEDSAAHYLSQLKEVYISEKKGLKTVGINPELDLVEIVEIPKNDYFVACQFHPEFKSRPNNPGPLFDGLINSAINKK